MSAKNSSRKPSRAEMRRIEQAIWHALWRHLRKWGGPIFWHVELRTGSGVKTLYEGYDPPRCVRPYLNTIYPDNMPLRVAAAWRLQADLAAAQAEDAFCRLSAGHSRQAALMAAIAAGIRALNLPEKD